MAPKSKGKAPPKDNTPAKRLTVGEIDHAKYLASRPFHILEETKGYDNLTKPEQEAVNCAYALEHNIHESPTLTAASKKEFWATVEKHKVPFPLPLPQKRGKDHQGRSLDDYFPEEYAEWEKVQQELRTLKKESKAFKQRARLRRLVTEGRRPGAVFEEAEENLASYFQADIDFAKEHPITFEEYEHEQQQRILIAKMEREDICHYATNPAWDDVTPIPQDDGENPLAAIAYTPEYAGSIQYLRAVMLSNEHSARVLDLTAHIIDMNPAHYTVWLYRYATLIAMKSDLQAELVWVNGIALENQKNYQIWHHRQILIDALFPTLEAPALASLATSEIDFLTQMFAKDSKNYHVWSYRQYLVRKLSLFPSQKAAPGEIAAVEELLRQDVRNNSAWSHRFFLVFSDPGHSTPGSAATATDAAVPAEIIDREIEYAKTAIWEAPQNQSPWNYLRGVLRKGGRGCASLKCFAEEFVDGEGEEECMSSHALDFLADAWAEEGQKEKAEKAWVLLGDKYDRIRKNYWDWRRQEVAAGGV